MTSSSAPEPESSTFQFIGSRIAQSLDGIQWESAWLSLEILETGVVRRTQRYRSNSSASESDFKLLDPIGVATAIESLQLAMLQRGLPKWVGVVLRLRESGEYRVEYRYSD